MVGVGNHLLVGGNFTGVNGDTADPYMVSLSPTTGKSDGFLHLSISGHYQYPGVSSNSTHVYNQQLSHGGTLDLVEGDFTSVGGLPRQQIFMLNVGGSSATVTGWTSPEWDGSDPAQPYQCVGIESFYIQAAAWSPDDSTVYIGTTGYHANGYPVGQTPRQGLCDAAAAFPATQTSVQHKWVNYTGCDSLYSAAADTNGAYFGGHERWSMNANDCDALGNGGYNAPGMEGLDPANGNLYVSPDGSAGYYSRDRGLGADDMLATSAGLWIASDNQSGSQMCGGAQNLSGICFLPYSRLASAPSSTGDPCAAQAACGPVRAWPPPGTAAGAPSGTAACSPVATAAACRAAASRASRCAFHSGWAPTQYTRPSHRPRAASITIGTTISTAFEPVMSSTPLREGRLRALRGLSRPGRHPQPSSSQLTTGAARRPGEGRS